MVNGQYEDNPYHHFFYLKAPKDNLYVHPDLSNTTLVLTKLNQNDYALIDSPITLNSVYSISISDDTFSEASIHTISYILDISANVSLYLW